MKKMLLLLLAFKAAYSYTITFQNNSSKTVYPYMAYVSPGEAPNCKDSTIVEVISNLFQQGGVITDCTMKPIAPGGGYTSVIGGCLILAGYNSTETTSNCVSSSCSGATATCALACSATETGDDTCNAWLITINPNMTITLGQPSPMSVL